MNVTIKMLDELVSIQKKYAKSKDKDFKLFCKPLIKYGFTDKQMFDLIDGEMTLEETLETYRSVVRTIKNPSKLKKKWTGKKVRSIYGMLSGEEYIILGEPFNTGINTKKSVQMRNVKRPNEILTVRVDDIIYSKYYELL